MPINFRSSDPVTQILALEPNGVTRVCDCVGYECVNDELKSDEGIILRRAVQLASSSGGIGVIGVYFDENKSLGTPLAKGARAASIEFPVADFWMKGLSMKMGVVDSKQYVGVLLGLIESGKAKPGFIFTKVFEGVDDAPEGYRLFSEHKEVKVGFRFPVEEQDQERNGKRNGEAEENGESQRGKRRRLRR